jgi:hypothetical protein
VLGGVGAAVVADRQPRAVTRSNRSFGIVARRRPDGQSAAARGGRVRCRRIWTSDHCGLLAGADIGKVPDTLLRSNIRTDGGRVSLVRTSRLTHDFQLLRIVLSDAAPRSGSQDQSKGGSMTSLPGPAIDAPLALACAWRCCHRIARNALSVNPPGLPQSAHKRNTAIHFSETTLPAGLRPSIRTLGEDLENACCHKMIELYKTESIRDGSQFRSGPTRILADPVRTALPASHPQKPKSSATLDCKPASTPVTHNKVCKKAGMVPAFSPSNACITRSMPPPGVVDIKRCQIHEPKFAHVKLFAAPESLRIKDLYRSYWEALARSSAQHLKEKTRKMSVPTQSRTLVDDVEHTNNWVTTLKSTPSQRNTGCAPTLITEQNVPIATSPDAAQPSTRRWPRAPHATVLGTLRKFVTPEVDSGRVRERYPVRYGWLENAVIAREMDRL